MDVYGGDDQWEFLAVEQPFNIVLKANGRAVVRFMSRFDGVFRDLTDGRLYLLETKTAAQIATAYLELDDQGGAYWAVADHVLRANGMLKEKESISGIYYNFLRKAFPDDRPQNEHGQYLNKDGSVSMRQPSPFFVREPIERSRRESATQLGKITDEVTQMNAIRSGLLKPTKHTTKDCPRCPFWEPCNMHDNGSPQYKDVLKTMFRQKDPYAGYKKSAAE